MKKTNPLNEVFVYGEPVGTCVSRGARYYKASDVQGALRMQSVGGKLGIKIPDKRFGVKLVVQREGAVRAPSAWMLTAAGLYRFADMSHPRNELGREWRKSVIDGKRFSKHAIELGEQPKPATPDAKPETPAECPKEATPARNLTPRLVDTMEEATAIQFYSGMGMVNLPVATTRADRYIPLKPICDQLGVDSSDQLVKLRKDERFDYRIITSTGSDGKRYSMGCLGIDQLGGWLYLINPNRVKISVKPRLLRYQKELTKAIRDYVTTGVAISPNIKTQENALMKQLLSAKDNELEQSRLIIEQQQSEINYVRNNVQSPVPSVPVPPKSTRALINQHVRAFATKQLHRTGNYGNLAVTTDYFDALWNHLYGELKARCHVDYRTRFKNRAKELDGPKAVIDVIDEKGMEEMYALVHEIMPVNKYNGGGHSA